MATGDHRSDRPGSLREEAGVPPDDVIPMLTEIVDVQGDAAAAKLPGSRPERTERDWDELADRIQDAVCERLAARMLTVVDEALGARFEAALDRAVVGLSEDLRRSVDQAMREGVARAVADEIAALRQASDSATPR